MPSGVHHRHVRHVCKQALGGLDAKDVGRVVQGSKALQFFESIQSSIIDLDGFGELLSAVHHPVTHGVDLLDALQDTVLRAYQQIQDQVHRFLMGRTVVLDLDLVPAGHLVDAERAPEGHPLYNPLTHNVFLFPVVDHILGRRAAAVQNQNLHIKLSLPK